ncbi:MAG TPA: hypothetical protein VGF40_02745 [Thermoanaerobaculia bacterium]
MEPRDRDHLVRTAASALLWIAAFAYAVSFYLASTKLLRGLPPTEPVAVGRVTVDGVSKARDYAGALLYFALVPPLAFLLRPLLGRYHQRVAPRREGETRVFSAALFALPYLLAPFLFLTTRKELWGILLPLVLSAAGPLAIAAAERRRWIRDLGNSATRGTHALLLAEGGAWILFRYLATGGRIGHIPTLFLEIPFAIFFLGLFWAAAILIARAWALSSFGSMRRNATSIALAAAPLLALPLLALGTVDLRLSVSAIWLLMVAAAVALLLRSGAVPAPGRLRAAAAWIAIPLILFVVGWTSIANSLKWTDLFHRGESLGPAAEYLAGEVPYRDVFVLHGPLDDGMLDAWVMRWAGTDVAISNARIVAMSALALVVLWTVAMLLFDSIPLSLLVVALGAMTFVENARALFELSVLALLFAGLLRGSRIALLAAGALSAITLFYSLDIGLYSIFGSIAGIIGWAIWRWRSRPTTVAEPEAESTIQPLDQRPTIDDQRRLQTTDNRQQTTILWYFLGLAAGAAPFLLWLSSRGALDAFFTVTFVEVPRFIDPVWSLPFPDLASFFRSGLQIRSIADFILGERSRFLLNPLILGAALVVLIARFARRRTPERIDLALLLLAAFGIATQRSAVGRADFPHQYFSAFLISPVIVALLLLAVRAAARVWRGERAGGRLLLAFGGLAIVPVAAALLWVPDLLAARLDAIVNYRAQRSPLWFDPNVATIDERIAAVSSEIRRLTPASAPIFDFSNQPALYFFAERRNPTRFFQIPIASAPGFQLEILRDLERERPPLVLRRSPQAFDRFDGIPNEVRAQAVAAYIDALYEHQTTVRGVEIWTRKRNAGDLSRFMKRISIPSAVELAASERVVIPGVASARGAAGADWVSDLVAQNPSGRPVELRLRYASNHGTRDRALTLAPGELRTFEDFPRTLFALGETAGALWIEYPSGARPLAFALTRDRARGGNATRSFPLSQSDAAEAGTPAGDLRIVGARSGGTRRTNVGAINVGMTPARIRIHATTDDGAPIGGALEWDIPEERSWLLVDVEGRLGVALDGSVVLHVTPLRGRAVAYASVIDGLTGIHELVPALPVARP